MNIDDKEWAAINNRNRQRGKVTAITFFIITLVTLVALTYAFVQKGIADEQVLFANYKIEVLKKEIQECREDAKNQQQLAAETAEHARMAQQQCEEALRKCSKK